MINFKKLGKSFKVAFCGLWFAVKNENTFKAGIFITIIVVFLAFYFPLSWLERAVLFLTISAVLGMELINTQIERITNIIDSNHNPNIRIIKDLSASAVLLLVIGAAIVAGCLFWPYIFGR